LTSSFITIVLKPKIEQHAAVIYIYQFILLNKCDYIDIEIHTNINKEAKKQKKKKNNRKH